MDQFLISVLGGLSLGATYALIALGIVLVFRTTGIFNLAHGQLMAVAAFVVAQWQVNHTGLSLVGIVVGLTASTVVSAFFYILILHRLVGLPHWLGFIATLALGTILDALLAIRYGSEGYLLTVPGLPKGPLHVLGIGLSSTLVAVGFIGIAVALAIIAVLRFTRLGVQVRAAGQDQILASQGGIRVRRLFLSTWAMAGFLAGVAGVLYASTTIVEPTFSAIAIVAIPAIVLGGMDSFEGAIVGGLLIGVFQGFVASYGGSAYVDAASYSLLLVVLLVYPRGLFGTENVTRL